MEIFFRRIQYLGLLILLIFLQNCSPTESSESGKEYATPAYYTVDDFPSVEKIDAHVHIREDIDTVFIKQAAEDNFRLLNVNVYSSSGTPVEEQQKFAVQQVQAFPKRMAWATTFSLENYNDDDWQKVHDFFIKYQDRLIYATDLRSTAMDIVSNGITDPAEIRKHAHEVWLRHWRFFTTDEKMRVPKVEGEFKGLELPREVVDKIYRKNAEKWLPGIKNEQQQAKKIIR